MTRIARVTGLSYSVVHRISSSQGGSDVRLSSALLYSEATGGAVTPADIYGQSVRLYVRPGDEVPQLGADADRGAPAVAAVG